MRYKTKREWNQALTKYIWEQRKKGVHIHIAVNRFERQNTWKNENDTISLHDHRVKEIYTNDYSQSDNHIICSCGKEFKGWNACDDFNKHQKEELNKQLEEINADVEVV